MPTYHWRGRTAQGAQIEGDLTAGSKDEVIAKLRKQKIIVSDVGDTRPADGPIDFRPAEPRTTPPSGPPSGPTRGRGLFVAVLFVAAGFGVGLLGPVTTWTCERAAGGAVGCSVVETDLGVIPIRRQDLSGVSSVDVERNEVVGRSGDRGVVTRYESRIVLLNGRGESIRSFGWDQVRPREVNAAGGSIGRIRDELQAFLADASQTRVSTWGGHLVPMILVGVCWLLALAMLGLTVLSFFVNPDPRQFARPRG